MYKISQIAKMFNIHPQTLRQYEREELLSPSRTSGGIREYSQDDIDKLKEILFLTKTKSVNLAGVKIILKMKNELEFYKNEVNSNKKNLPSVIVSSNVLVPI